MNVGVYFMNPFMDYSLLSLNKYSPPFISASITEGIRKESLASKRQGASKGVSPPRFVSLIHFLWFREDMKLCWENQR